MSHLLGEMTQRWLDAAAETSDLRDEVRALRRQVIGARLSLQTHRDLMARDRDKPSAKREHLQRRWDVLNPLVRVAEKMLTEPEFAEPADHGEGLR